MKSNQNVKIAIIDSGVNVSHPALQGHNIHGYRITNSDKKNSITAYNDDKLGHGTAVSNIICSSVPDVNIDVFSVSGNGIVFDLEMLLNTLYYIADNQSRKYHLINLSMGTYCDDVRLRRICKHITDNGTIIVAAFDNAGAISFPAAYDFVVGVDSSEECIHNSDIFWVKDEYVNILAKGGVQRVAWNFPDYVIRQGASFAAAHVSAIIAKFFIEGYEINGIKDAFPHLREAAIRIIENKHMIATKIQTSNWDISSIKNAIIYPFNKEMHNLVNMSDLLRFTIVDIVKTKYLLQRTYIDTKGNRHRLSTVKDCNWSSADTLILGHIDQMESVIGNEELDYVFKECAKHNLNVYAFDEYGYERASAFVNKSKLLMPQVNPPKYYQNKLFKLSTPVLGVFGTTSSQGKFHLLLTLSRAFKEAGYKIGILGTEPTSELFGADEVYPYGYNSIIKQVDKERVCSLNHLMHRLDLLDRDIILFSAQSGVCPLAYNNIGQLDLEQHFFLLGTMPDAVILCVNSYDEDEYIRRSILYIESLTMAKVIGICLYPLHYKNDWYLTNAIKVSMDTNELFKTVNYLNEKFHLPVFVNGNVEGINKAVHICEDFFS